MIAVLVFVHIASDESPKVGSVAPEIGMHRASRSTSPCKNGKIGSCIVLTWTGTANSDLRELSDGPCDSKPQDDYAVS
jgi:hypothetical protein